MKRLGGADQREIWTLIIGGMAALASAVVGALVDLPKLLKGFVADPTTWTMVITVTVPILITLTTNQIAQSLKSISQREQTLADLIKLFPDAAAIIHFDSSAEAMRYLTEAVVRVERLYNTRLTRKELEVSDALNFRLTRDFDRAAEAAVRGGMDYSWLISEEFAEEATALKERRALYARYSATLGTYSAYVLPRADVPFLHFCILDYGTERELLIGWALSEVSDFSEQVYLIRDRRFVDYFRDLFLMYCRSARPV